MLKTPPPPGNITNCLHFSVSHFKYSKYFILADFLIEQIRMPKLCISGPGNILGPRYNFVIAFI